MNPSHGKRRTVTLLRRALPCAVALVAMALTPSVGFGAVTPTVTSITPTSGTSEGGTPVTIKGTGFEAPATVTIGGEASAVTVVSETEITATTPAHAAGGQEVVVKDAHGTSTAGPTFTYVAPPPPPPVETKPAGAVTQTTAHSGATVTTAPIVVVPSTTPVKPTVKVIRAKLSGNALLVTVKLSQKGTVRISGTGLRTTIKRNLAAGSHRIRVPLTKSGVAARQHHRKLVVHVALTVARAAA